MLTLDQFRATGRDVADLRAIPEVAAQLSDDGEARPGRIYAGDLFIETSNRMWVGVSLTPRQAADHTKVRAAWNAANPGLLAGSINAPNIESIER